MIYTNIRGALARPGIQVNSLRLIYLKAYIYRLISHMRHIALGIWKFSLHAYTCTNFPFVTVLPLYGKCCGGRINSSEPMYRI